MTVSMSEDLPRSCATRRVIDVALDQSSKGMPRVLVVVSQSGGGIWHYACALSRALAATSVEVALAAPFPFEPIESAGDIPVWPLGTRSSHATPLPDGRLRRMISHVDKLRGLHRAIVGFRPGIVHLHDRFGQLDFIYFRLLKSLRVRIVYTAHEVRSIFGRSNWLDRARHRQVDAVLVHSSNGVSDLVMDGIEQSRIVRIPHANYLHFCPTPEIPSARAKSLLGIPSGSRLILFFGTIAAYKGLAVLVDAFSQLCGEDPGLYLAIAGEPVEDFEPYMRQIEKLQLKERVISDLRYIPFREFGAFFSAADAIVLPYQRIYQSGVLQLAYAFGRPVVVTDVGGLGDTVAEDSTGLVAPGPDARAVASAIRELLSDPDRAEEMGRRGRRLAATKYSWEAVAKRVVGVYRSLGETSSVSAGVEVTHPRRG